jgi:alkanesulfonate monooxygenase SsuD/methylene tetrahydromethanopterin reductase-like flavin-dependent oxidoreductase (luciferase family)
MMGAEGPKNVALAAEIADGWLPLYYSPFRQDVYSASLSNAKADFEVTQGVVVNITDDVDQGLLPVKHMLALYVGGMGAKDRNFHKELIGRMGFEGDAEKIQELYLAGKKQEAAMAVPDALADEISLVGPVDKIRDRLQAWDETPVTSINVSARSTAELETLAQLVLDR